MESTDPLLQACPTAQYTLKTKRALWAWLDNAGTSIDQLNVLYRDRHTQCHSWQVYRRTEATRQETNERRTFGQTHSKQADKTAKTNGRTTASYVVNFGFKSDVIVMNAPLLPI